MADRLHPPPPGKMGVLSAWYGQRPGNMPIQSGFMAPFPVAPPVQLPWFPQPTRNFLEEQGFQFQWEPVQRSFFQQVGQTFREGVRSTSWRRKGFNSRGNPCSQAFSSRWGRPFERVYAQVPWSVLERLEQRWAPALLPLEARLCAASGVLFATGCWARSTGATATSGAQQTKWGM